MKVIRFYRSYSSCFKLRSLHLRHSTRSCFGHMIHLKYIF